MSYTENNIKDRHRIYYLSRAKGTRVAKKQNILLSKTVEGFLLASRARQLSEHTIADYSHTFKIFQDHVGDAPIVEITSAQIAAFLASQTGKKPKTILNYHVGLSALWTWAIREGFASEHILRKIDKPRPTKVVVEPISETEFRALFTGLRNQKERDTAIILILLDTGIRASELCNIQRKDIDLVARRVKVLGKGDKERLCPFSPRTASAIFRHLTSVSDDPNAYPFEMSRSSLEHHLKRIGRRANVSNVHPHRFRHYVECWIMVSV